MADWTAIRAEYVSSHTSYRKLAEKHGVNKDTIALRGKAENWAAERDRQTDRMQTRTIQKVVERASSREADRIVRLLAIGDKLAGRLAEVADADDVTSKDMQQLTVALRNLHAVMQQPAKTDAGIASGQVGPAVVLDGPTREASE